MNSSMMDCTITARLECIENYKDAKHEAWINKRKWILNMKISKLSFNNSKYHKPLIKLMYPKKVYLLTSYHKLQVSCSEAWDFLTNTNTYGWKTWAIGDLGLWIYPLVINRWVNRNWWLVLRKQWWEGSKNQSHIFFFSTYTLYAFSRFSFSHFS